MSLNDQMPIPVLIEEILSLISSEEEQDRRDETGRLILCDVGRSLILPKEKTLKECHVTPGSKLMLI
ncbi:MAG: hypothetical protein IJ125_02355 [Atopobiaceae bacterium]|nr:hypothetical protein [Atopobiaceae bacterium]